MFKLGIKNKIFYYEIDEMKFLKIEINSIKNWIPLLIGIIIIINKIDYFTLKCPFYFIEIGIWNESTQLTSNDISLNWLYAWVNSEEKEGRAVSLISPGSWKRNAH